MKDLDKSYKFLKNTSKPLRNKRCFNKRNKMAKTKQITLFISILFRINLLLPLLLSSCKDYHRNKSHADVSVSSIEDGKELAVKYCQSCHLLPDPSWADSKTWDKGILPNMAARLGIFYFNGTTYPSRKNDYNVSQNFYPSAPVLTNGEWQNIIDYYTAASPDTLSDIQKRQHQIKKTLPLFSAVFPPFTYPAATTSFIKIYTSGQVHEIIVCDVLKQTLFRLNNQLQPFDSIKTNGALVDIEISNKEWIACNIGVLNPNTGRYGKAEHFHINQNGNLQKDDLILPDQLARPVQITAADLNKDGRSDYIICEFGYFEGSLSWLENLGNDTYKRHVLRALPGAIKAYVQDYNHDGLSDIWALFAQGDEGIFLYTNKGNGQFSEERILRFPPIYGSSYFELDDFNKDGFPDIVYTCGDNADYSTILKPYHGVYIFLNDGKNHFAQKYFFPINGCYKAIARDYDGDGDVDIATISFFADYKGQPEEGFVYLENKGNYNFMPQSLQETQSGRWLTMDAGDIDGDGKVDIVLGNFSIGPSIMKSVTDWKKGPPFLLLKNTGK